MPSRRKFFEQAALVATGLASRTAAISSSADARDDRPAKCPPTELVSLCGRWKFRVDAGNVGSGESWYEPEHSEQAWTDVEVPHTWQVDAAHAEYRGVAWYRRLFDVPVRWRDCAVRIEFEAVFHTAKVWLNGEPVGEHVRKGYTAFELDLSSKLRWGQVNTIAVRVDSAFDDHMLPRGRSSDWAHDGGIFRPVQLLITPTTFVERVAVEAVPDLRGDASVTISAVCRNASAKAWTGTASFRVLDESTGLTVATGAEQHLAIDPGQRKSVTAQATLQAVRQWHFDSPQLYSLEWTIADERAAHTCTSEFGVRQFEIRDGQFHLNGDAVRLMGVERMAGSHPRWGMTESTEWIERDHRDLKDLNCIFTRAHWPQDKRVLDYCDRHGILVQLEIPAWGPDTFKGMGPEPDSEIVENGLEQLREMIGRDRNHPAVVAWGLCNEIDGQNPPAYKFAKRMLAEAKRLDPSRLCSYASNSLGTTPERDVAGLMDFIETNEYFGTWAEGTAVDAGKHLNVLHAAFPDRPIVISEYGYCACTKDRPEGDGARIETLRTHDAAFRSRPFVAGAIFFCYNDYRTHVGDRGFGALQQRVHGVVDIYGAHKPSYEILRAESSPVESLTVERRATGFRLQLRTRETLPAYILRGYQLRGILYGQGGIPVEEQDIGVPDLARGQSAELQLQFRATEAPVRVRFEVIRPTGFSAYSVEWKPPAIQQR